MPDRTKDPTKRRTSTLARVKRLRERRREAKRLAKEAAKIAHRQELDAARARKGLPPARTPAQRVADSRARKAAAKESVRTESWFSEGFADRREACAYIAGLNPTESPQRVEQAIYLLEGKTRRWQLHLNKFVCKYGAEAARIRRAIVWQCWERLSGTEGDFAKLHQAMQDAERQEHIQIDSEAHPTQQRQELMAVFDFSQVMLDNGSALLRIEGR